MHVIEQDESIVCDNQINQSINHKITYVGPPTTARSILHELIPQIPLIWNYENYIHAYLKSREIEDYLKPKGN